MGQGCGALPPGPCSAAAGVQLLPATPPGPPPGAQFLVSALWWDSGPAHPPPGWRGCDNYTLSSEGAAARPRPRLRRAAAAACMVPLPPCALFVRLRCMAQMSPRAGPAAAAPASRLSTQRPSLLPLPSQPTTASPASTPPASSISATAWIGTPRQVGYRAGGQAECAPRGGSARRVIGRCRPLRHWCLQPHARPPPRPAAAPVNASQAREFSTLLSACLQYAVDAGLDVSINVRAMQRCCCCYDCCLLATTRRPCTRSSPSCPKAHACRRRTGPRPKPAAHWRAPCYCLCAAPQVHLDDGRRQNGWRNTLEFDPLQRYRWVGRCRRRQPTHGPMRNPRFCAVGMQQLAGCDRARRPLLHRACTLTRCAPCSAAAGGPTMMRSWVPLWTP